MTRRNEPYTPHGGPEGDVIETRSGSTSLESPALASPATRSRRAWTLIWLTQLLPGSAQLVGGNRRLGRRALRLIALIAAFIVVGAVLFLVNRAMVLNVVARPFVLYVVAGLLLIAAIGWGYLFLDARRLATAVPLRQRTTVGVTILTAALMLLTCGTLTFGANAMRISANTVSDVFGGGTVQPPSDGRYNVLLLGGDSGASREGLRPDTIMLASVDAKTGKTVLFGFARDTENIDFNPGSTMRKIMPEGWNCGDQCLLNGLYTWAHQNADKFPPGTKDPGVLATAEAVEWLSGLDVSYYGLVDLKGFQRFIDAVGGIQVTVGKPTPIGGGTSPIKGYIQPGRQHLDGYHALWYARSREGSNNYERMQQQQCVVTAMLHQLDPATVLTKYQDIAGAAGSTLVTNVPPQDVGTLSDLALKARSNKIKAVNLTPPLIKPWDYDVSTVRGIVEETIAASEADDAPPAFKQANTPSATGRATSRPTPSASAQRAPKATPRATPSGDGDTRSAGTGDLASVCSAGW